MGIIPDEIIREILDRTDIVALISSSVALRPAGRNFKALCPFHPEKTPSFVVNPDKQIFHCFGCGVGGNAVSFLMQQDRMTFPEAIRSLAQQAGVTIPADSPRDERRRRQREDLCAVNEAAVRFFHRSLVATRDPAARGAREYLKARGLSLEQVKTFQIGFAPDRWDGLLRELEPQGISPDLMQRAGLVIPRQKSGGFYDRFRNRIIFPIFDVRGRCVAFGARTLEPDNPAKYINSPETEMYIKGRHLYGLHLAKADVGRLDRAVVVEGYMDFVTPHAAGVHNVVASLGTALTVEQIRLLRRYTRRVVMLFDGDRAGESAVLRSLDLLLDEEMQVRVARLDPGEDPDSFVRRCGRDAFEERLDRAESLFDFKLGLLLERHGTASIEARAAIAGEMLPTVGMVRNAVIRSEYFKRLSEALQIPQESLLDEWKRGAGGAGRREQPSRLSRNDGPALAMRPAERNLLRLMMEETDFIRITREEARLDDFSSEPVRRIMTRLFDLFDRGQAVTLPSLMSGFDDPVLLQAISGLMAEEEVTGTDRRRLYRDCLRRLQEDRRRERRQELRRQMERARQAGDADRLHQLLHDFNTLVKTPSGGIASHEHQGH